MHGFYVLLSRIIPKLFVSETTKQLVSQERIILYSFRNVLFQGLGGRVLPLFDGKILRLSLIFSLAMEPAVTKQQDDALETDFIIFYRGLEVSEQ